MAIYINDKLVTAGAQGDPGPGVASGGTTGQMLAKASDADFDTHWIDPPDGSTVDTTYLVKAPIGTIVIWSGEIDAIPSGWHLCDGSNGTPDLRDKFVVGASGEYAVGNTGGEATHALTVDELPSHSHNFYTWRDGAGGSGPEYPNQNTNGSVRNDVPTGSTGSSQPHNNLPPYYALCYIMKIAPDPAVDGVTQDQLTHALATKQDAFEVGSSLEMTANARTAGGRLEVKTPVHDILTESEYNALSETQKSKGLYVIDDGNSGSGGSGSSSPSGEVYSTEEVRIGTWIDGKPLYRKIFKVVIGPVNKWTTYDSIDNLDALVKCTGFFNFGTIGHIAPNPAIYLGASVVDGVKKFGINPTGPSIPNNEITVIAEYTKTTDTGGAA